MGLIPWYNWANTAGPCTTWGTLSNQVWNHEATTMGSRYDYEGYLDSSNRPCGKGTWEGPDPHNSVHFSISGYAWEGCAYGLYQLLIKSTDRTNIIASASREANQVGAYHGKTTHITLAGHPCPDVTSASCTADPHQTYNVLYDNNAIIPRPVGEPG